MTQAVALAQYGSTGVSQGFKNRIINGAMVIDQRNAGASVSITGGSTTYTVDRWAIFENGSMAFSAQRSTTAPTGFINSLLVTTTTGAAAGADDRSQLFQRIEGFNTADLNWGTANAKTVTLSFWVRSSLTGQFGGSLQNSNQDRSYPFSFTISSANTFEYKTITIAGDTSGTWLTDNSTGIQVLFDLGMGSNLLGTAGAWASADYRGATGDTKLSGTTNATLYLTAIQLEVGSTATSFDYRPYGTELALCQRYYQKSYEYSIIAGTSLADDAPSLIMAAWGYGGAINTVGNGNVSFQVPMRTNATMVIYDKAGNSAKISTLSANGVYTNNVGINLTVASQNNLMVQKYAQSCAGIAFAYTASAEL
jgi:hypothetical protein